MSAAARLRAAVSTLALCFATAGCLDVTSSDTAICVLIDVSGTYANEKGEVVNILKRDVLPSLVAGDTLITILIDSDSYQQENVTTLTTLDARPSRANAQKLALAQELESFAGSGIRSRYTDIPGAMMLGAEYLRETGSTNKVMLVFSDLREELPKGATREMREDEFQDVHVVTLNVKRLGPDSADPEVYRGRLQRWENTVQAAGGAGWRTILDAKKLQGVLEELRS